MHNKEDLNTSDHLPISVRIDYSLHKVLDEGVDFKRIDWDEARRCGSIEDYMVEVRRRLSPFLNSAYICGHISGIKRDQ